MKKYLYYPNMEPPASDWLKFSVIYLEKLESIIPYNRQNLISDEYRRLRDETDLVDFFSPTHIQGEAATFDTIPYAERMLRRNYDAGPFFRTINVRRDWQNSDKWGYQVYAEKFSQPWIDFCEHEKIGKSNADGIRLHRSLAYIYMTHLAKRIAFDRNTDIITDDTEYDRYTNLAFIRTTDTNVRDRFIRGIIQLQAPRDISTVSLSKLIEFRKNNRELIRAFNKQIDRIESCIGDGLSEQKFIDDFNYTLKEVVGAVAKLAVDTAIVPLAFYALAKNVQALDQEYIKEVLSGVGALGGGIYGIKKSLYDSQEKRWCKKYLANLRKLK